MKVHTKYTDDREKQNIKFSGPHLERAAIF